MPSDPVDRMVRMQNEELERLRAVERFGSRARELEEYQRRGGKDWATVLIAAPDSHGAGKATADYVCDGEDDQDTINQAIQELPDAGGKIVLLEGTYHVSNSISDGGTKTVWLDGMGGQAENNLGTTIEADDSFPTDFGKGVIHLDSHGSRVSNLCTHCRAVASRGIRTEGTDGWINGCVVRESVDRGFYSQDSKNLFTNCIASDCDWAGFGIEGGENLLLGCVAWGGQLGFSVGSSIAVGCQARFCDVGFEAEGAMIGCRAVSCDTGMAITGFDAHATGCLIYGFTTGGLTLGDLCTARDCLIQGGVLSGPAVSMGTRSVLTDCFIDIVGEHGIVAGGDDFQIMNNYIRRCGQKTNATYDGIFLSNADRGNVQGNTIRHGGTTNKIRYGINVSNAGCNDMFVTNNDLMNSGVTGSLNNAGTATILVAGNRL